MMINQTSESRIAIDKTLTWLVLEIRDHTPCSIGLDIRIEMSQKTQ
jgi:hypothetical protein